MHIKKTIAVKVRQFKIISTDVKMMPGNDGALPGLPVTVQSVLAIAFFQYHQEETLLKIKKIVP